MTPYDYHTVGRLNRADRLREREEIRQAKALKESNLEHSPTPGLSRAPRTRVRRLTVMMMSLFQAVRAG
jgi:hypothetical protein